MSERRDVAVMMPFGGSVGDETAEEERQLTRARVRKCKLEFLRLSYILGEKVRAKPHGTDDDDVAIDYSVSLFNTPVGDIASGALKLIDEADVIIGLITEKNVNVVYELAIRDALRDIPIIVLKGDPDKLLPVYLKPLAYIRYSDGADGKVAQILDEIADADLPDPIEDVPENLKQAIDRFDNDFINELEKALQMKENERPPVRSPALRELFRDPDPSLPLKQWDDEYYPFSVVRIPWRQKSKDLGYAPEDMDGDPEHAIEVCHFNHAFRDLFDLRRPSGVRLTMRKLLDRLSEQGYIDDANLAKFEHDQGELIQTIAFEEGFATARVALNLTRRHRKEQFQHKSYLPCLIARRVVGDERRPHNMYLMVSYIDVTSTVLPQNQDRQVAEDEGRLE